MYEKSRFQLFKKSGIKTQNKTRKKPKGCK